MKPEPQYNPIHNTTKPRTLNPKAEVGRDNLDRSTVILPIGNFSLDTAITCWFGRFQEVTGDFGSRVRGGKVVFGGYLQTPGTEFYTIRA